jgi:hypothetical protein
MVLPFVAGATAFLRNWWPSLAGFGVGFALGIVIGLWQGAAKERARADAARALANAAALETKSNADERASLDRVADMVEEAATKERLIDAVSETPDTVPSAVRVRLGCQRLREQGTDTADIPGCGGR